MARTSTFLPGPAVVALSLVLALGTAACRGKTESAPGAPATVATTKPVDHLGSNELVQGPTKVFELPLPRVARVHRKLGDTVYVNAACTLDEMATYLDAHTEGGKVTRWKEQLDIEHAHVKGAPSRILKISAYPRREGESGTTLVLFDETPAPSTFTTEADRYKSVGLLPNGKLVDPKQLD
ncbi:MAG: hypothetical protein U0169_23665 [Polyangiaceae bacterium]